ncbi:MAG: PAS domain S-box protein [Candidatus Kapabacteria bacterium]|nr:PAS domain S-box protein [Candidatus Kapabacteria bacterium]
MKKLFLSKKVILLALILSGITFIVTIGSTYINYITASDTVLKALLDDAESDKNFVETLYNKGFSRDSILSVLNQVHKSVRMIGSTGELVIGELYKDSINFIVRKTINGDGEKISVSLKSNKIAGPMRSAMSKKTGNYQGLDYRGSKVFAGYTYFAPFQWGIVSKISVEEVREPFIYSLLYCFIPAILLTFFGSLLFIKVTNPMITAIRKSEENLSITLNSIGDGVISTDEHGMVVQLNPVAEKLCGWKIDEARGKPLNEVFKIINAETRLIVENPVKKVIENGQIVGLANHTVLISRDGKEYQIADSAAPIKDVAGRINGVVMVFSDVTERYAAEYALRKSQEQLNIIFQESPVASVLVGMDKKFIKCNSAFSNFLGYSEIEIIGRTIEEVTYSEDVEIAMPEMKLLVEGKIKTVKAEKRYVRKNGELIWGEIKISLVHDENNKPLYFLPIIHNISDRKKAELELKESEATFRELWNATIEGITIHDRGIILKANDAMCRMFGYEPENVIGMSLLKFAAPEVHDFLRKTMATDRDGHFELPCIKADGTKMIVETFSKMIRYKGKDLRMAANRDITERKKAEAAVYKAKLEWEAIFHGISHPTIILGPDNNILEINEATERMLGKNISELKDLKCWEIFHGNAHSERPCGCPFTKLLDSNSSQTEEMEIEAVSGTFIVSCTPIFDAGGKLEKVVHIATEITERKKAENALKASELRLQLILENMPILLNAFDDNGNIIVWNKACEEATGYSAVEIINNPQALELLYPDIDYRNNVMKDIADPKYSDNVYDLVKKNKEIRTIEWFDIYKKIRIPGWPSWGLGQDITDRLRAEELLRQSEEKFRNIYENSQEGIFQTRADGSYISVNTALAKMYGYDSSEELMDNRANIAFDSYFNPEDRNQFLKIMEEKGLIRGFEYQVKHRDGHNMWFYEDAKAIKDENGNLEYFEGFVVDITEKKLAEEALKASYADLRRAEQVSKIGYWTLYLNEKIMSSSENANKIYGFENNQNSLSEIQKVVLPEFRQYLDSALQEFIVNGKPYDTEYKIRRITDNKIIDIRSVAEFDRSKNIIFGVIQDITERKDYEAAIIKSEKFLKETQKIANLGTYNMDIISGLWESSAILDEIFGIDASFERTVEGWASILHPDWRKLMTDYLINEVFGKGVTFDKEYVIIRINDRSERWLHGIGELKFNENHVPIIMIGTIRDITEKKLAEELLIDKNHEIEAQYEEYMQLNEQLRKTNYELEIEKAHAEESEKLKTSFLQNMSHEIRTPLNGIMGFSGLLRDYDDLSQDESKDYINIIVNSSNRLLAIVDDVLDISRIDSNSLSINKSDFLLTELLHYYQSLYNSQIRSKGLNFIIKIQDKCSELKLLTDKDKLSQIITNLMNNATKFTHKGEIELGVNRDKDKLNIYVRDTGIGIKGEYLEKIFDRFWQYEAFVEEFYGGTGLGLSISKGLAELLGLQISVESVFDQGTTFTLTFNPDSFIEKNDSFTINKTITREYFDLYGLKVLIVDDEETNYLYLKSLLKRINSHIHWARNGQEAIDMCQLNSYDLILMDLKMPVMNGFDATRKIREFDKNIFIIAQTAYTQGEEKEHAIDAGCDEFICKPIERENLFYLIREKLRK